MLIQMELYKRNEDLLHVQENPIEIKFDHKKGLIKKIITDGFRTLQHRAKSKPFSRPPQVYKNKFIKSKIFISSFLLLLLEKLIDQLMLVFYQVEVLQ